ncbi:MAG: DUF86 domain-containing protein [Pseudonocardiales bacterium]|nr:DUF86 domain-containing protein [Pseudonocardiales bacterium]
MVDRPRIDQLLTLLAGYVRILRKLATTPLAEFAEDPRNYGSAERFLQLAIETTLSIGHHVIADAGLSQPSTYAEVFAVLGKEGVLDAEFARALQPMARMRNRLVHHYEDIAPERVHEIIGTGLDDFDRFAEQIAAYADRA